MREESEQKSAMMRTKLLSLMISRLCHDLLNPVGVVLNSISMLEEDELLPASNSLVKLLKESNMRSLRLIKCYNLFFGSLLGVQSINNEDLYRVLSEYLYPINLQWNIQGSWMKILPKDVAQIIGQGVLLSENLILKTHHVKFQASLRNKLKRLNLDFRFDGMDINVRQLDVLQHMIGHEDGNGDAVNPSTINMLIFCICVRRHGRNIKVRTISDNALSISFDLPYAITE